MKMWVQLDFFPGNISNLVFSNFVHVGFCGPKVSTKY